MVVREEDAGRANVQGATHDLAGIASDIQATRTLSRALALFGINVFDHLIITSRRWCSMLAEGYL
jgi:DNA repair protein RadC